MNSFIGVLLLVIVLIVGLPTLVEAGSLPSPQARNPVVADLEKIGLFPSTFEAGLKAFNEGNPRLALRIWQPMAESGHTLAQYNMGVAYAQGSGVHQDLAEASRWWKLSALKGHRDSAYNLGLVYARGAAGVAQDLALAAHWWQQAAIRGDAIAQYNLGMMYARGEGVQQNMETAVRWWQMSAGQGFVNARKLLDQIAAE